MENEQQLPTKQSKAVNLTHHSTLWNTPEEGRSCVKIYSVRYLDSYYYEQHFENSFNFPKFRYLLRHTVPTTIFLVRFKHLVS